MLNPKVLSEQLHVPINYKTVSASTQQDAKAAAKNGESKAKLFIADHQTAAVGRFERPFHAQEGDGIYMSLLLPGYYDETDIAPFTMMTAAAIILAIKNLTHLPCQIKWVNDIYLNQKKISGILTEAVRNPENLQISHLIIGVGLNFSIKNFPDEIKKTAGSLFGDTPPMIKRENLICEIWKNFNLLPQNFLIESYKKNSLILNKQVSFKLNHNIITGTATTITDSGQLIVETTSGEVVTLSSGEISLLSW